MRLGDDAQYLLSPYPGPPILETMHTMTEPTEPTPPIIGDTKWSTRKRMVSD